MTKPDPSEIIRKADDYRQFSAELLSNMIKIPSVSGNEKEIIKFLENEFKNCGADEVRVDDFGNVIAKIGNKDPVIAFDAHVDTVDIGNRELWDFEPFSGDIKEDKVYGRGTSDQKAGMASMVSALKILKELYNEFPFTVYFVGSVYEEDCDGLPWQYLIKEDNLKPDVVILTEPTDGKINRGQRGRMELEVSTSGISCHGSAPERGDNAIYKIAPIISALEMLNNNLPGDSFLGKGSLTISQIKSDSPSLCAVADFAEVYIDRRLTGGETPEGAKKQIESLPEVKSTKASVKIPDFHNPTWRGLVYPTPKTYPAWILPEEHHSLLKAKQCFQELFNKEPVVDKWIFSTNGVATMGMFSIPTFGFGPGMEKLAHAPNEYVEVDDIVKCTAFYVYYPLVFAI